MKAWLIILLFVPFIAVAQKHKPAKDKKPDSETSTVVVRRLDTTLPVIVDPSPLKPIYLEYPPMAKASNLEGNMTISAYIDTDGTVIHAMVKKSFNKIFDETAIDVVKRTPFSPATMDGKKIKAWVSVPIMIRLTTE
jgi:TonB family protein